MSPGAPGSEQHGHRSRPARPDRARHRALPGARHRRPGRRAAGVAGVLHPPRVPRPLLGLAPGHAPLDEPGDLAVGVRGGLRQQCPRGPGAGGLRHRTAAEVPADELADACAAAFARPDPEAHAFTPEELSGAAAAAALPPAGRDGTRCTSAAPTRRTAPAATVASRWTSVAGDPGPVARRAESVSNRVRRIKRPGPTVLMVVDDRPWSSWPPDRGAPHVSFQEADQRRPHHQVPSRPTSPPSRTTSSVSATSTTLRERRLRSTRSFPLGDGDDPAAVAGRVDRRQEGQARRRRPRPRSRSSRSSRTCPGPASSTRRRRRR